jgi:hypothetical protein
MVVTTTLSMLIPFFPPLFICRIVFAQQPCPCFPSKIESTIATHKLSSLELVRREHPWSILSPAQIAIHEATTPKGTALGFAKNKLIFLRETLLTISQWCRQPLVIDI